VGDWHEWLVSGQLWLKYFWTFVFGLCVISFEI